jgi:3-oxoacyl-[acyl-carrier-protein] synthase III
MGITIDSIGLFENKNKSVKTSLELCRRAAEPCIKKSAYSKEDIGLVVSVSVYRDDYFCEPSFSSFVQNDLKINHDKTDSLGPKTLSLDVLNGAMGFLNACQLCSAMITAGKVKTGLVVSSDLVNGNVSEKGDPPGFLPTGAAMLLAGKKNGGSGFKTFYFKTFTEMQDACESYMFHDKDHMTLIFKRDPAVEDIYLRAISMGVSKFLEREAVGLDDFDMIIPSQISSGFITKMAGVLGVKREKMIDVTREGGNLFNASIPAAMDHIFKRNKPEPGQKALIINVASGIQVGCAVYEF